MSAEVLLVIPYDTDLMSRVRQVPGARWDRERRVWSAPDTSKVREAIAERGLGTRVVEVAPPVKRRADRVAGPTTVPKAKRYDVGARAGRTYAADQAGLSEIQQAAVQRMQEVLVRRQYAYSTRKTYVGAFRTFLPAFPESVPSEITKAQIEDHLLQRVLGDGISESLQNTLINAIKFYYEQVLGRERTQYDIARPVQRKGLPKVLAREEIGAMIQLTQNGKHRCMLMLLYGGGLRLGEVVSLLPTDIDSNRMTTRVDRAKGKKDRVVPLPTRLLEPLREYYRAHDPVTWLFEGQTPGEPYSKRSLQHIVKQAARRAKIARPVTAHMLRHSYATAQQRGPFAPLLRRWRGVLTSATFRRY